MRPYIASDRCPLCLIFWLQGGFGAGVRPAKERTWRSEGRGFVVLSYSQKFLQAVTTPLSRHWRIGALKWRNVYEKKFASAYFTRHVYTFEKFLGWFFFFLCSLCDRNAINTLLINSTQNHCNNEAGAQVLGEAGGKNDPLNARGPTLLDICVLTFRSSRLFLSWGLHCAPYDTVTSSHGKVLIARHFPLASVNSHSDRGLEGGGGVGRGGELSGGLCGGEKVSCSYLAVFFFSRIMSYYLRKSQLIWDMWTGILWRTSLFSNKRIEWTVGCLRVCHVVQRH